MDFNVVSNSPYSSEDAAGNVAVADAGATLVLTDNTWRKTDQTFNVTVNTVLEFDFESTVQGEIHGIGFDENSNCCDALRVFKVHGAQVCVPYSLKTLAVLSQHWLFSSKPMP